MDLNPKDIEEKYDKEVNSLVKKAGALLRSKYGLWFLGILTFADSALGLPFSMDPFMVAYMVANRAKALWGYVITVLASALGGVVAYLLAALFINQIFNLFTPEMTHGFHHLVKLVDKGAFLFSFLGSFSPIPYTLVAITAGALKVNLFFFIIGSLLGRAIRFGVVAYFVHFFGPRAVEIAKRNVFLISAIVLAAVAVLVFLRLHF
jgi:membrane protein YqaA with SNARE-associated domain